MNWSDFGERNRRLNPLWNLGSGMNIGELNPYKEMLALSVLLQVYYLELESSERRSREDLISLTWNALTHFKIGALGTAETVERLVDGLLWSSIGGDFEAFYYDNQSEDILIQKYKYFTVDEDATRSSWEQNGKTIFRLSEYALEMIFMSHEIIEEFQISIKLLEIQMHIKHGRVNRAMQDVNELIARVRKLIQQQKEYRNALRRNPGHIFSDFGTHRRIDDIETQFNEERKHFDNIHRAMSRLANDEKDVIDFNELRRLVERVELSRRVHDELAEVILNIFELETNLRLNYPELFWGGVGCNFRDSIWEEWVKQAGLPSGESLDTLIQGLFTPKQDFLYPLHWAWSDHDLEFDSERGPEEVVDKDNRLKDFYTPKVIPWTDIAELWAPIFVALYQDGEFTLSDEAFTEAERRRWAETPDAVDLWLQFCNTEVVAMSHENINEISDECQLLIYHVMKCDPRLKVLQNRRIRTTMHTEQKRMIRWPGITMSPFRMTLEERRQE